MPLLAFFFSGAAGLIFEMVWLHRCGIVFGNSVDAAAVVLSSFMGGLALGNALAGAYGGRGRPLRTYAVLELAVAATGLALTALLPTLTQTVAAAVPASATSPWLVNTVRFIGAFALLAVPATAMGATLPVLAGALAPRASGVGVAVGRLYGWNTAGAVAGVLAAELVIVQRIGMVGASAAAAALNAAAAALVFATSRSEKPRIDADLPSSTQRKAGVGGGEAGGNEPWRLLACAALAGLAFLALEVVWFRFLSMFVLTTTLAMSVMLAVVLSAIAGGGLAGAVWLKRAPRADGALPAVAALAGAAAIVSYASFGTLTNGTQVAAPSRMLWFAVVLTGLTAFASGVLFTLFSQSLGRSIGSATRAAAWLTLANTLGGTAGPAVAAFVLLPRLGTERAVIALAVAYGVIALAAARDARGRAWSIGALATIATLGWLSSGAMTGRYVPRVAAAYAADGAQVVSTREGPTDTIFLMRQEWLGQTVYDRLVTNGFSMSGTAVPAKRYMRDFVYLPMLLHQGPLERILVICYGAGVTAGAATDVASARTIDVVDVSRDIIAMSDEIYPPDRHPLHDPRVRVHVDDGRSFLQRTGDRYDLITGEPPPPRNPGAVAIYTREYFRLLYARLAEGGMATYWLPVARPDPGTDVDTIIRAFCDVLDDCSLWNATPFDFMLLGSRHASGPPADETFTKPWVTPGLEARLREVGFERPEQMGATFLGDAAYLRVLTADTPPVTDDFPQRLRPVAGRVSLSDPRYGTDPAVARFYQGVLDPDRAQRAFQASAFIRERWPASLVERTLPMFAAQKILNRVLWEGARPMQQVGDLHMVLTRARLRTLPLWMLGSDDVKQRIGESAVDSSGTREYSRALRALTGRDYVTANTLFAEAERRGVQNRTIGPLRVIALCLSGYIDEAKRIAAGLP